MNIMTSNSSDRAMVHIRNRRSQEAVRWYVLTLPTAIGGRDNIYSSKGLDAELSRRKRCGEPLFEYFAPSYVEARKVGGKMVNTRKPLLYNYVFIHASENEIFRLKRIMPLYNLLPRVSVGEHSYFPYLSDHEMETLRWMAESYSNELPVYVPDSGRLLKGDRSCRDGACPVSSPYNGILVTIRRWETEHAPSLHDVIWSLLWIT